ncbi:hypothetical protein [Nocardioides daejeonensis]|uniref:hypothetical protein n=1 Tax=Nocardioides daejeonensis TaxID=1046556 RepID=UPI000D74438C|nr:hypothetical protein [Nocardioides daejeonensis]
MTDLRMLEALRPPTSPLDEEWEASTLREILADPVGAPRRHRRRQVAALATVGALLAGGGAAWATGQLPALGGKDAPDTVRENVAEWGGPELADDLRVIVDVTLPDGTGFVVWRTTPVSGAHGECEASSHIPAGESHNQMWNGGSGCGTAPVRQPGYPSIQIVSTDAAAPGDAGWRTGGWYPVVYGSTESGAASVRVTGVVPWTGTSLDTTFDVDPQTGGYAGTLPGSWKHDAFPMRATARASKLTFTFLDSDGQVVERFTDTEAMRAKAF